METYNKILFVKIMFAIHVKTFTNLNSLYIANIYYNIG